MSLAALAAQAKPGDYFVVQTDGLVARGIRLAERHNVNKVDREGAWANHAGIFGEGGVIYQASPPSISRNLRYQSNGFQRGDIAEYEGCRIAISSRPLTDAQRELGLGAIESLENIPYSLLDIVALGISTIGAVPDPVWDRLNRPDRLICSQAVAHVSRVMGDPLTIGPDCRVTPAHLARASVLTGSAPTTYSGDSKVAATFHGQEMP